MKPFATLLGNLIVCSLLISCRSSKPLETSPISPHPTLIPTGTSTPVPNSPLPEASPTPAEVVAATLTPTPQSQKAHYQIWAELDYATYKLSVEEKITIPNPAPHELTKLALIVPPNFQRNVFHLQEVSWGGEREVDTYSLQGIRLDIPIREAWFPGASRELILDYQISLPEINSLEGFGPNPFGYKEKGTVLMQLNLVDWYPFLPPYQEGTGWLIHEPWVYGEYLVYSTADYDVSLEVINAPRGLVVAASSPDQGEHGQHRYQLEGARNFAFSISPHYRVLEQEVDGTKVFGYIYPFYEEAGKAAFQTTVEAFELYADLFHPYHQSTLSMVQAYFDHGMEYEGLYFLNRSFFNTYDDSPDDFLVTIAAHETAHQWWYGLVGNDQALEPWLDEAICTYSELLYFEKYYPEAVDWWWTYRVNYYQPQGVIDRSIYETTSYLDYRDSTYLRGAQFWAEIRDAMGDEVFYSFLQAYAETYKGEIISGEDFFSLLAEYTRKDLEEWVRPYFEKFP